VSWYLVVEYLLVGIDFLVQTFQAVVEFRVFGFLTGHVDSVLHVSWKGVVALILAPKVGVIFGTLL
jgi:hypothetical protein